MNFEEYGGYIEFERFYGVEYHREAYRFNTARHALRYVLSKRKIKEIYLPQYLCPVIITACILEDVIVHFYNVREDLHPDDTDIPQNAWFYFINYYGQFDNGKIEEILQRHPNMIVDNVQAFFQKNIPGVDTIYTCRKFFGVPDGAYLYTNLNDISYHSLPQDESRTRVEYLIGRLEQNASAFYKNYCIIQDTYDQLPIMKMSKFTHNVMCGINYDMVKQRRTRNFNVLHEKLEDVNLMRVHPVVGGYMYPLMLENAIEIRKKLIEQKIFIPVLWEPFQSYNLFDSVTYKLINWILPCPIDQRYTSSDMKYIANIILDNI